MLIKSIFHMNLEITIDIYQILAQCGTCLLEPYTQEAEAGGASTSCQPRLQIKTLLQNTKNEV